MKYLVLFVLLLVALEVSAQSLTVTVPALFPAYQNQAYNSQVLSSVDGTIILYISGGTAPYTCSITSGSLPTGLTLSEVTPVGYPPGACMVKGTPTVNGDFPVTVQATDNVSNTASASVPLVVITSSPPMWTVAAGFTAGSDSSRGTINWTSNVAATSQVCISQLNAVNICTPEQDLTGVTSHSVSMTNLWAGNGYQYFTRMRGISGGSPQDYLVAVDQTGCCNNTFSVPAATTTGNLDFTLYGWGPHNVFQGSRAVMSLHGQVFQGSSFCCNSWKVVVTGIPTNSQVTWPDQQILGVGGTISTTTTTNDTLTIFNPTNTQFGIQTNVGGTTPTGNYTLTVTTTSTPTSGTQSVHSYTWTLSVISPSFPSGSPASQPTIPNLSTYNSQMIATWPTGSGGQGDWYNGQSRGGACTNYNDDQGIQYYDGEWVYDQIGMYTNNLPFWVTGTLNSSPCALTGFGNPQGAKAPHALYGTYLNSETPPGNGLLGIWLFPHGLFYDCKVNGVSAACTYLHDLAANNASASLKANFLNAPEESNVRETCYALNTVRLDYDAAGGTTLPYVKLAADMCIGQIDQIINPQNAAGYPGNNILFEQPFMDGLVAESLIEYYLDPNTGNGDSRVPYYIKALADHLWAGWLPWAGTNGYFVYNVLYQQMGMTPYAGGGDMEALNLLIAPLFAFVWKTTGLTQYQQEGDTIFNSGVNDPTGNGIGFTGKNFSQQYRWSMNYPLWRGGTSGCFTLPASTCGNIYVAQTAGTFTGGTLCNNQTAITPSSITWVAGSTYVMCGTMTFGTNTTGLTVGASGTSSGPITILFDTGAILQSPQFAGCTDGPGGGSSSPGGAINTNGQSYIIIDGQSTGTIQNTANGNTLANDVCSLGLYINGDYTTVRNLTIKNIYQWPSGAAADNGGTNTGDIYAGITNYLKICNNTISNAALGAEIGTGGTTTPGTIESCNGNTFTAGNFNINNNTWIDHAWVAHFNGSGVPLIYSNDLMPSPSWQNWHLSNAHTDGWFFTGNSAATFQPQVFWNYIRGDIQSSSPTGMLFGTDDGVVNSGKGAALAIYENIFYGQGSTVLCCQGIALQATSGDSKGPFEIYNNVFVNTEYPNENYVQNAGTPTYDTRNNIYWLNATSQNSYFYHNENAGWSFSSSTTFNGNDYFGGRALPFGIFISPNTFANFKSSCVSGSGTSCDSSSITTDPLLSSESSFNAGTAITDGSGFYETSSSPTRSLGDNLTSKCSTYVGLCTSAPQTFGVGGSCGTGCVARPTSGPWDAGAYQFSSGPTANTPTFSPVAGTYTGAQNVTISTTSSGAIICYAVSPTTPATNGSTGCTTGTLYSAPVAVSASETLNAVAGGTGYIDSSVGSAAYTIIVLTPTFSPVAPYTGIATSVTISDGTAGATIIYTLDGSTPTESSCVPTGTGSVYSSPIFISVTRTLKAIGCKAGLTDSAVASGVYTITPPSPVAPAIIFN